MLNLTDEEELKRNAERGREREAEGKQFKTFRKQQIVVWLGIEPTPPVSLGGRPALGLVVKSLPKEAARAPVEHSSHPRKGLMHGENRPLS